MEAQVQIPIPNFDFNPTKWVEDAFGSLLQSFSDGIRAGMDAIWDANFITQTPPSLTYRNDDIRGLYDTMRGAANAALATIATVGALNGMLRPHLGLRYHSLSEFVPRLLVGAILVNTALWWVQFAIDVNNALAAKIGNATPPNWNTLNGAHQALTDIVLGLVYMIVGLLLLIQMLMRLAWIDVLLVISPLAAACWVLPQTQGWHRAGTSSSRERCSRSSFRWSRSNWADYCSWPSRPARAGRDVALVSDWRRDAVVDVSHSGPDAGRCWWKHRRHAR